MTTQQNDIAALAKFLAAAGRTARKTKQSRPPVKRKTTRIKSTPVKKTPVGQAETLAALKSDNLPVDAMLASFILRDAAKLLDKPAAKRAIELATYLESTKDNVSLINLVAAAFLAGGETDTRKSFLAGVFSRKKRR